MIGITSYGMYVPYYRLTRKTIGEAFHKRGSAGEKAVAAYDEDSFTMGLAAAMNCIAGCEERLDALYFASTTAPNAEKQCAAQIASGLDIEGNLRTGDFAGTMRAGAAAMLGAADIAKTGGKAMVIASDARLGAPDGKFEDNIGDGAAAFCFGSENVVAELTDSYSVSHDFHGIWRGSKDAYPRVFDEAYARDWGYVPFVAEAVKGLLGKTGITQAEITKVVLDAPDIRSAATALKKCGFAPEQAQQQLITDFGYSGTAYAPTMLACALEQAKVGDVILYVAYGEGADALLFKVTAESKAGAGRGLEYYLNAKDNTLSYERYLSWKKLLELEPPRRPELTRSSLIDLYRKRAKNLACHGSRCTACGTPFYPPQRVCVNCHAVDQMEDYKFSGRKASLATFSMDYTVASENPPNILAVVDFEGGGRMFTQMVECDQKDLRVGLPVELACRKLYTADHITVYAWKCVPAVHGEQKEAMT